MKNKIVINSIITLMILSMGYMIVTHQTIYNNISIILICLSLILYSIGVLIDKKGLLIIGYLLSIITIILVRRRSDKIVNDEFYIIDWIKLIFENEVVFINVIGNIVLYIPLYILLNGKFIIILVLIIVLELLQYILELGVFDIIDILLNITGLIITMIMYKVNKWITKIKI